MTGHNHKTERAAEWAYSGVWRALSGWFRVPQTPPMLPTTEGEEPDAFKPALGYLRYMKLSYWIVMIVIGLSVLIGWLAITVAVWWAGLLLAVPGMLLVALPGVLGYVAIHLRYDTTWYVMTERSLRIRRGIWVIHEMTFTFENVQNVKVQQGPLQRLFGVSDLIVETAGSGGDPSGKSGPALNQGRVEGVADAWALRKRVLAKLKASRSAGFGDDQGRVEASGEKPGPGWTGEHIQVLRAIRDELVMLGE